MTNEPRAMKEIHDIRLQIYEEIKDMTPEERIAMVRLEAQAMINKYGLKIKRSSAPQTHKAAWYSTTETSENRTKKM